MGPLDFLKKVFGFFKSDAFKKDVQIIAEWTPKVLPYVEAAAKFTSTATDDQIVEWAKSHIPDLNVVAEGLTPDVLNNLITPVVRTIVKAALVKADVTEYNIPDRLIDAAIQMAYVAVRRGVSSN